MSKFAIVTLVLLAAAMGLSGQNTVGPAVGKKDE